MTSQDELLRAVAKEFKVPCSAITGHGQQRDEALARHVWWYLLAQMPGPTQHPTRGGGMRPVTDKDGGVKRTARVLGKAHNTVKYAARRVEDLRDDPAFDARIERLEALIAGA